MSDEENVAEGFEGDRTCWDSRDCLLECTELEIEVARAGCPQLIEPDACSDLLDAADACVAECGLSRTPCQPGSDSCFPEQRGYWEWVCENVDPTSDITIPGCEDAVGCY